MDATPPPSTNAPSGAPEAPPVYSAPGTKPLVSIPQIKNHLALLHAFAELKLKVEDMAELGISHLPSDQEPRWAWFIGLSVERFEKWCKALQPSHSDKALATLLPPVDVLMVWHAYLLNPRWYAEDGDRVEALKGLQCAGDALATSLGSELGELLASEPTKKRIDNWVKMTATPFDPFEAAPQMVTRQIACPKCRSVVCAPYMTESGTGYLQQGFAVRCVSEECSFEITKDTLALRKLASDLTRQDDMGGPVDGLASTVHSLDRKRGRMVETAMLTCFSLQPETLPSDVASIGPDFVMERGDYKLDKLRAILAMEMKGSHNGLIGRIMSAYVDDKLFSVDLVGAVLRQGSFVNKMYGLQWTQSGFFDRAEDEVVLQHAIARYHAFLGLMSSSPAAFFVPTLDIDLAWHTHQLMATKYSKDTVDRVGRFIDHDDKVEESYLASSFDTTCRAWKKRYGVQYTHCGCALPGETIGEKPAGLGTSRRREKIVERNVERGDPTCTVQHDPASLIPVPMYYKSVTAGPAIYQGDIVNGVGSAACGSGCGGGCGGGGCGGGCGGGI
ncbi:hypothetical protein B0H17DRAFT_1074432 [Mycena rosella]|uniref:Uncharacterized protein n=1 Tax=Mycena rosella TaxID=1033263 RepID=A0AAD7D8Z5_MYCRO|nr:hypothetical protein B0H17DRAFT_1074432 [Mycena rosella]